MASIHARVRARPARRVRRAALAGRRASSPSWSATSRGPAGPDRPAFAPSAIWSVPAAGGEVRRLTFGRCRLVSRAGRPTAAALAFLSDREKDGRRQVHLLPRDGGEARQLTDLTSDIPVGRSFSPLGWFPDGSRVVFPLVEPLDGATQARIDAGDDRIVFEEEPRFWRLWTAQRRAAARVAPISPPGLQIWEFAISPDGRRVAAIASDQPYEWDWYDARLVVFDVGARSLEAVTHDPPDAIARSRNPSGRPTASRSRS